METLIIKVKNNNLAFVINLLKKLNVIESIETKEKKDKNALSRLKDQYKHLPISWPKKTIETDEFSGIWHDKNISIEQIREKGWKRS